MSAFGGPNIIDDGLVLYLDAGNIKSYPGSGTTWFDKSGRGNNGTLTNGPTFNTGSLGSVVFDGTNDYVNVNTDPNLPGVSGSVSVWFNISNTQGSSAGNLGLSEIILKHNNSESLNGWSIIASTSSLTSYIKNGSTNWQVPTGSIITPNTWYNAVITFQSNTSLSLYTNGIFISSVAIGTLTTNTNPLRLAVSNDPFWARFQGRVASTQVYNRALTAQEVLQNYNATKGRFGL
jgi:hypothetical protein